MRKILWAVFAALVLSASAPAATCRALIVSGDPGPSSVDAVRFSDWSNRWAAVLTKTCGFKPDDVRLLRSPAKPSNPKFDPFPVSTVLPPILPSDLANLPNVLNALEKLVKESGPEDQAVLILIGHGYSSQGVGKLCLPGKDLSDIDAAKALSGLKAKLICIDTTPSSSTWAKALSRKGRITIVAAATAEMGSQTYFCEFLLQALSAKQMNLLDAFNAASMETISFYQNQFIEGEMTTVNGKRFQEIWKSLYPGRAITPGKDEPQAANNDMLGGAEEWRGRRVLMEVAGLDDNGDGEVSTLYEDAKTPTPLPSKAGEGNFARTITLGKP